MDIQKFGKYLLTILVMINLVGILAADTGVGSTIQSAICEIVNIVQMVMGAVMLILIVFAAIIYAAGQVMGAETRARANVWATSMFVGALIGALIYILVPVFLSALLPGENISEACTGETT